MTACSGADASVVYYGGRTEDYLGEADRIAKSLWVHLGEEDEYISKTSQTSIIDALGDNPWARVFTYPGCKPFARHGRNHYYKSAADLPTAER